MPKLRNKRLKQATLLYSHINSQPVPLDRFSVQYDNLSPLLSIAFSSEQAIVFLHTWEAEYFRDLLGAFLEKIARNPFKNAILDAESGELEIEFSYEPNMIDGVQIGIRDNDHDIYGTKERFDRMLSISEYDLKRIFRDVKKIVEENQNAF